MSLNELMNTSMGHFVRPVKTDCRVTLCRFLLRILTMKRQNEKEFNLALINRLSKLRNNSKYANKQDTFAKDLGTTRDTYSKYETRSPLPRHLFSPAAKLLNVSVEYLLTGENNQSPEPSENIELSLMKDIIQVVVARNSGLTPEKAGELCTSIYTYLKQQEMPLENVSEQVKKLADIFGKTI